MSAQRILENFGVKLKKDTQASLKKKQRAKAMRYGSSFNENSNLSNSVRWVVKESDSSVTLELIMADYWEYVDAGRLPTKQGGTGKVKSNIEAWIKRKGLNPNKILEKYGTKKQTYQKAASQLAYLIARKIHRKGFEGNQFFSDVINDGRIELLKAELTQELKKDIIINVSNSTPNAPSV